MFCEKSVSEPYELCSKVFVHPIPGVIVTDEINNYTMCKKFAIENGGISQIYAQRSNHNRKECILLFSFETCKEYRRKGYGKMLLGGICNNADLFSTTLVLHMDYDRAKRRDFLYKFYIKMGFILINSSHNNMFDSVMIRSPK
jgi:GNAT superfamily N-acetyltransferase